MATKKPADKKAPTDKRVGEVRSRPPTAKPMPTRILLITLTGLLSIALVWAMIATFTDFGRTMHPANSSSSQGTPNKTVKITRSVTGKSLAQDQKDALDAATKLLNLSGKSPTGSSIKSRLQTLDTQDTSVIDKKVPTMIQFSDDADSNDKLETYKALVYLYATLSTRVKKTTLTPESASTYQNVSVDRKLGLAYVPLNSFVSGGAAFSLEMVYQDGAWKLSPHTLLDALNFSTAISQALSPGDTSSASPSATASK